MNWILFENRYPGLRKLLHSRCTSWELADRYEVSTGVVLKARRADGVVRGPGGREPGITTLDLPGLRELLGKVPDAELAALYGISAVRVGIARRSVGIIRARGPRKTALEVKYPGMRELLGTVPDTEIARLFSLTRARVGQIRCAEGIPRTENRHRSRQPWLAHIDMIEPLLGKVPDSEIARRLLSDFSVRMHSDTIKRMREERGIAGYVRVTKPQQPTAFDHLLGAESDLRRSAASGPRRIGASALRRRRHGERGAGRFLACAARPNAAPGGHHFLQGVRRSVRGRGLQGEGENQRTC